ncbi:hypothetical protein LTR84_004079 [Exophiala bonariae]|uniref:C2H2-type domain-containing protein n=1 Tax=Exophiala bonariae TaxID=1690606 RepID=A0AAV9N568_9EURO|nr:hypothetical protein LTR84_004079 [Exophiala bonariae]
MEYNNSTYQDLLGSERPEYANEPYGYGSHQPVWSFPSESYGIDPYLDALPSHGGFMPSHYYNNQPRGSGPAYDPVAHGFGLSPPSITQEREFQLGMCPPSYGDIGHFRYTRQTSPPDCAGFAASSTESTTSDYALSPDIIRPTYELPLSPQDGDLFRVSIGSPFNHNNWNPQSNLIASLPSSIPTGRTPLRMSDLQVTPEPEGEDDLLDVTESLHAKLIPEELELSEQLASPADSGLGLSIHDDDTITVKDEEDVGAIETDNDSDFYPGARRSARGSTSRLNRDGTLSRRLSGTRRSSTGKGVLGQPRVSKPLSTRKSAPAHSREKKKNSTSRTRVKKSENLEQVIKSFPCTFHHYGCKSTFASKNEWKRHVASQHLRLGYYRCDMGSCSADDIRSQQRGFNDFNRKDLFTQHCRRMHAPWSGSKKGEEGVSKKEKDSFEKQLETIRTRCWVDRRKAPVQSSCGFCGESFIDTEDGKAWDARMEHVGRHFERDTHRLDQEAVDSGLREWAIKEGLIQPGRKKGEWWLLDHEPAGATPASADRRRSGRTVPKKEEKGQEEDSSDTSDDDCDADTDTEVDAEAEAEQDDTSMQNGIVEGDEDAEGEDE